MKNISNANRFPEEMEDIRSGKIFQVPEEYFDELTLRFFDRKGRLINPEKHNPLIKRLQPWLVAASLLLIISLSWKYYMYFKTETNTTTFSSQLKEYIDTEIMNYDLQTLVGDLDDEDLAPLSNNDADFYEDYLEEYLDEINNVVN